MPKSDINISVSKTSFKKTFVCPAGFIFSCPTWCKTWLNKYFRKSEMIIQTKWFVNVWWQCWAEQKHSQMMDYCILSIFKYLTGRFRVFQWFPKCKSRLPGELQYAAFFQFLKFSRKQSCKLTKFYGFKWKTNLEWRLHQTSLLGAKNLWCDVDYLGSRKQKKIRNLWAIQFRELMNSKF